MVTSYTPSFPFQNPFKMHTSLAGENVIILQEENGCVKGRWCCASWRCWGFTVVLACPTTSHMCVSPCVTHCTETLSVSWISPQVQLTNSASQWRWNSCWWCPLSSGLWKTAQGTYEACPRGTTGAGVNGSHWMDLRMLLHWLNMAHGRDHGRASLLAWLALS